MPVQGRDLHIFAAMHVTSIVATQPVHVNSLVLPGQGRRCLGKALRVAWGPAWRIRMIVLADSLFKADAFADTQ